MKMNTRIEQDEEPINLSMKRPSWARASFHIVGIFNYKDRGADVDDRGPELNNQIDEDEMPINISMRRPSWARALFT